MARSRQPQTIEELLDPRRVWVTPCGCWLWLGGDDGYGDAYGRGAYGRILKPGTRIVEPVHRYVFKTFKGPIPPGYDIDHICARWSPDILAIRKCVNPDHLQAVLPALNQQLKMLRRLGYGTEDMDLRCEAIEDVAARPAAVPLLAPGESLDDWGGAL
jgi:hypothetical protein